MPSGGMTDKMRKLAVDFMSESWNTMENRFSFEIMLPPFPSDKWSFRGKPEERVIVFDLSGVKKGEIPQEDLHYMLQLYERDDVVVLTRGVVSEAMHLLMHSTKGLFHPLSMLKTKVGAQKPACRFDIMKKPDGLGKGGKLMDVYYETGDDNLNLAGDDNDFVSGQDFAAFVEKQIAHHEKDPKKRKTVAIENVKLEQIDLDTTTVYMKDWYLPESASQLDVKMREEIKLPTVPHGEYCMMRDLGLSGQLQLMGLGYLTYGGGSKFHADARGQMDSGHICLKGYNHVFILRRLELDAIQEFINLLKAAGKRDQNNSSEPEDFCWPSNEQFRMFRELRYIPIRLILKPNEHLHIPSSRYHCFRKATNGQLPETDCHYQLHSDLLKELKEKFKYEAEIPSEEFLSFSYTWDFVYTGVTLNGIKRNAEVMYTMASVDQSKFRGQTPAVSRTSILLTAHNHAASLPVSEEDVMVPDLQFSKTMVQALSPTVQLLKKELEEEFEIVRQLEQKSKGVPAEGEQKRRGRPKKTLKTKVDNIPHCTFANGCDHSHFLHGTSLCCHCGGELFNLYFQCKGCSIKSESLLLCKKCVYSPDKTLCDGDITKVHDPSNKKEHQNFDVRFRFHHFQKSPGDSAFFKTIQEALAKMRVDLLRKDPADDDADKGTMSETDIREPFVEKWVQKRKELSVELKLDNYPQGSASELMDPMGDVCQDSIAMWRNLLMQRELQKQVTSPETKASYSFIFPPTFYTMYENNRKEKFSARREAYGVYTKNWDLPNQEKNPPWEHIFQLDKLLIPVHVKTDEILTTDGHWILICCHMSIRTISVYDTDLVKAGKATKEASRIRDYLLEEEYIRENGSKAINKDNYAAWKKTKTDWKIEVIKDAPQQSNTSMDCAVFLCLFMDFLLLDLPVSQLTQEAISEYGRKWLFMSICCNEILLDKN